MTEFELKYPYLHYLIAAYFHQDADLEYQNAEEALEDFCVNEPSEEPRKTIREIKNYLSQNRSTTAIKNDLFSIANTYPYRDNNLNPREFLQYIVNYIQNYLEAHSK